MVARVLPLLMRALDANSQVVHTYAAACIDGIFAVRCVIAVQALLG
jgi:hypothetical protein